MSKLAESVDRINREMGQLKDALQLNDSISNMRQRIRTALQIEGASASTSSSVPVSCSTPIKSSQSSVDSLEDFPNSPTLEQLGLSGPTLSIVGRRTGFDSSASVSDTEFDNSFYQKYVGICRVFS